MGIRGIFRDFLDRNKTVTVNVAYSQDIEQAAIESYALSVVINLISNLLSKCEIQTKTSQRRSSGVRYGSG